MTNIFRVLLGSNRDTSPRDLSIMTLTLGQKSIELEEALANLSKASETFASLEQKNSSDSGHFEVCIRKFFYGWHGLYLWVWVWVRCRLGLS